MFCVDPSWNSSKNKITPFALTGVLQVTFRVLADVADAAAAATGPGARHNPRSAKANFLLMVIDFYLLQRL